MKKLWLHSVRGYIRLGMFFYFKKVVVYNVKNIPKNKPVLILSNHQNALLDALLIATIKGRFFYFLTRAAVFKKSLVSKILESLNMLPIYRIRDGWNNLSNNNAIFETCTELLNNNESIVIFPEGNHNLERRVRPLSKGFTRIVFDTLEKYPNLDLQLLPVGLNFQDAKAFPDSTSIFFGEPIAAKDFIIENRNEGVLNLKKRVQFELSKLTTHIPEVNYASDLDRLTTLNVDFLKPNEVNNCIANGFSNCESTPKSKRQSLRLVFKVLLVINLILPYVLWKFIVEPKITEIEFLSTFRFAIAITLVPFWLLALTVVFTIYLGWMVAILYLAFSLGLALLAVKT